MSRASKINATAMGGLPHPRPSTVPQLSLSPPPGNRTPNCMVVEKITWGGGMNSSVARLDTAAKVKTKTSPKYMSSTHALSMKFYSNCEQGEIA
jgi:hypothetical protein